MMQNGDVDVIVVGAGAWGAMAAWQAAELGLKTLVLDRFAPPHDQGSSWGLTRIFRTACYEHPGLTPIAANSLVLYRELERNSGNAVIDLCGGMTIGSETGFAVPGVLEAARLGGLDVEVLDREQVKERYPFHAKLADDDIGVVDPLSGALFIQAAIAAALESAVRLGATLRTGVRVMEITPLSGGYRVETTAGAFTSRKVIVALGSWSRQFFPELPLKTTRMPMTWFAPRGSNADDPSSLARSGVFIREFGDRAGYWGHGAPNGGLAKIGPRGASARGDEPSVEAIDRRISAADADAASEIVKNYLPTLDPSLAEGYVCHSTRTPDEQFIVGEFPGMPGLVVACGESGHGGKHAAGIGRILARLSAELDAGTDIDFMRPDRFL